MRLSNQILISAIALAGLCAGTSAQAAVPTLSGAITADNEYAAFLSTSDNTLGTLLTSGANWQSAQTFSAALKAAFLLWVGMRRAAGAIPRRARVARCSPE